MTIPPALRAHRLPARLTFSQRQGPNNLSFDAWRAYEEPGRVISGRRSWTQTMASLFMRKFDRNASVFSSDDPGHKRLRQFRLLELVAERLNGNWKIANSSDSNLQETYAAYKLVEKIVSSKSLIDKGEEFTVLAAQHPILMKIETHRHRQGGNVPIRVFTGMKSELGSTLSLLWQYYFHAQGWMRLKRCPICQDWFVDLTSDTRKARCSQECTNRWWSYSKRKEADYPRFKDGGYHGTKRR